MFDKKHEYFLNGKTFYMIDKDNFEIRKTKIYGYQFNSLKAFYVFGKIHYMNFGFTKGLKNQGIKKMWEKSKPSFFHTNIKDAILFAKIERKNFHLKQIALLEERIARNKEKIANQQEKINSISDETIVVKEGVFDNLSPDSSRGYL